MSAHYRGARVVHEGRPLDYLYDPIHVSSGHQRQAARVSQTLQSLRRAVQGGDRLSFIHRPLRPLRPAEEQSGQHLQPLQQRHHSDGEGGSGGGLQLALHPPASSASVSGDSPAAAQPGSSSSASPSSFGCQTDYRESATQTLPFSPPLLLDAEPSEAVQELLRLQSALSAAAGSLPASLREVELIRQLRERRQWEASLPPLSSPAGFERRAVMIEQREWADWQLKEHASRAVQEQRMRGLLQGMDDRQQRQQQAMQHSLQQLAAQQDHRAARADERRRDEKRKAVRVLGKQRLREEQRAAAMTGGLLEVAAAPQARAQPDAVFSLLDYGSAQYAPLARSGSVSGSQRAGGRRAVVDYDIPALRDYRSLQAIHSAEQGQRGSRAEAGERLLQRLAPSGRAAVEQRSHLLAVDAALAEHKEQLLLQQDTASGQPASSRPLNVYKRFCPTVRAPTPSLPDSQPAVDRVRVAALTLQRLLRGRAQQNAAMRGRDAQQALITELIAVQRMQRQADRRQTAQQQPAASPAAAVDDDDDLDVEDECSCALPGQLQSPAAGCGEAEWSLGAVDALLGLLVSDSLQSLLSSHQQRLEVSWLSAQLQQNLFVRRVRESEEAGRRQAEEELRQRRERQWSAHTQLTQDNTARQHTQRVLQAALRRSVDQAVQTSAPPAAAEPEGAAAVSAVVSNLLSGFVFPEVSRLSSDAASAVNARRHLHAAHSALLQVMPGGDCEV